MKSHFVEMLLQIPIFILFYFLIWIQIATLYKMYTLSESIRTLQF